MNDLASDDDRDLPPTIRPGTPDVRPYLAGRAAARTGEPWIANPHRPGTREWFAHEDGRADGSR